jgi:hypothetical protein
MALPEFPALDHQLSPRTGWTRAHWAAVLARMTDGYARAAERSGSPARALYPDDRRGLPDAVDAVESFARMAGGWGAWLHQPANPSVLEFDGRRHDIAALLRQGLLDGTDPNNPYTYWGAMPHMDQRLVESGDFAAALWMSRTRVFDTLTAAEQQQIIAWLAQVDGKGTYYDNWVLFPAVAQAVRRRLGFPIDLAELDSNLDQADDFYRGDGWYVDGPSHEYELYNAWMFNWHFLLWAWIDGDRRPDLRQRVLDRARSFLAGWPYFFGANGVYVPWGRSLVYRFAAVAGLATGHLHGVAPADPGLLRRASSGCLRYFYDNGLFDPDDHYVRQGFHGDFPPAGEAYISPGSVYWCCHGLFALSFAPEDPFWTAIESPLPVERADFELVLPAPGFQVSGRQATGQVLLLNSRAGQEYDSPGHNYTSKYGKLVYSTHFPFNVLPVKGAYAPDAMLALAQGEQAFGHRLTTRTGGVAPGLMWTRFDEDLHHEAQVLWAAVLLDGDRQVRVGVIRPSFPVQVVEAPGALGCAGPAAVTRRSDQAAGWEYAEAEGRAVGIQRLLSYDGQQASQAFRGHGNLNLAYPYAEQPTVLETQPNITPRAVASVSLVRPGGFDPAAEFAGYRVAAEPRGHLRVTFPNGAEAVVVLHDPLPQSFSVAGVELRGPALRYARVSPGLSELCGLGLTSAGGIVICAAPATLRLARQPDGSVLVTTDVGVLLDATWLGGTFSRAAVQALDGTWQDVSEACAANAVPPELVQAWARRSQRTLITFRLAP